MAERTVPEVTLLPGGAGATCRAVLAQLPAWFGIPASVEDYAVTAETSPTVVATEGGEPVGFLTFVERTPSAAEIVAMGVVPGRHRQGTGRAMLELAEAELRSSGIEYLQVKTLSSSRPDEGYARTRAFYAACGFRPLEEMPDLWDAENPAVQLVKRLD